MIEKRSENLGASQFSASAAQCANPAPACPTAPPPRADTAHHNSVCTRSLHYPSRRKVAETIRMTHARLRASPNHLPILRRLVIHCARVPQAVGATQSWVHQSTISVVLICGTSCQSVRGACRLVAGQEHGKLTDALLHHVLVAVFGEAFVDHSLAQRRVCAQDPVRNRASHEAARQCTAQQLNTDQMGACSGPPSLSPCP